MLGNDVVRVDPEDPLAKPGIYYAGVFGVKDDSRYSIEATLAQKHVYPPAVPPAQRTLGFALIRQEVDVSDARLRGVASGGSLLRHLPSELHRSGHETAHLKAAAHKVSTTKMERERRRG